jgi:hypothetical protein
MYGWWVDKNFRRLPTNPMSFVTDGLIEWLVRMNRNTSWINVWLQILRSRDIWEFFAHD